MKESHRKRLANCPNPESCVARKRVTREAEPPRSPRELSRFSQAAQLGVLVCVQRRYPNQETSTARSLARAGCADRAKRARARSSKRISALPAIASGIGGI